MVVLWLISGCKPTPSAPAPSDSSSSAPEGVPGSARTDEDADELLGQVEATDADDDLDPNGFALVDDVAEGTLVFAADGTFTFAPDSFQDLALGESRTVGFTFTATDAEGATSIPAGFAIEVEGRNDVPTVVAPLSTLTAAVLSPVAVDLGPVFEDADGDTLILSLDSPPPFASLSGTTLNLLAQGNDEGGEVEIVATDAQGATVQTSVTVDIVASEQNDTLTYTAAGRLSHAQLGTAEVAYTQDANGNMLRREVTP